MGKVTDYQTSENANGLARIGAEPVTVLKVHDFSYDGEPSIRSMTQKPIEVDGVEYSEFLTSRKAILDTVSNPKLRQDLENNPIGPVQCKQTKAKGGGKDYWVLVDAE